MANITAQFYNFTKRLNSTKQPTGIAHTDFGISFKDGADLEKPTIELHSANAFRFNYCYIDFTARYYFVDAVRSIAHNTYEIDLIEDYLATFKSALIGQRVYASFASYNYDVELDDVRVVPVPTFNAVENAGAFDIINTPATAGAPIPLTPFLSAVTETGEINGVDVFFGNGVTDYIKKLADESFFSQLKQNIGGGNPFDVINELWLSPLDPTQCHQWYTPTQKEIYGEYVNGNCISSPVVLNHRTNILLPHPSVEDFRFSDKYVKYYLHLPYVGVTTIPTALVRLAISRDGFAASVELSYAGDCLTGSVVMEAKLLGVSLGIFGTTLKAPLPLARQTSRGAEMAVMGGLGGFGSGAASGFAAGGIYGAIAGGVIGGIGGAAVGSLTAPSIDKVSSSVGSVALAALAYDVGKPRVEMVECLSDIDPATLTDLCGRPCERVITINNGYIQTRGASLAVNGTDSETEALNAAFNTGVYVQ